MASLCRFTELISAATWWEALALLKQVDDEVQVNAISYNAVLKSFRKSQRWKSSLEMVQMMIQRDLPGTVVTYNSLLSSVSEWQLAEQLMNDLQRALRASIISYNTVLNTFGQDNCWELALHSKVDLQRRGMLAELLTQNTLATACERSSQWWTTLSILVSIKEVGLDQDAFSCSAGVKACGNSAQWRKAVNVLESSYSCKIETNAVCHTAAISACERSGEWQIALKLLTGNVVPNLVMYNAALNACATGAQWQLALDLFLRILNQRLQVDVISYNSLSLACEEAGNWRRALEFLQLLETVVLPNAVSYGILICTYGAAWRWQDALCSLQSLETDLVCCTSTIGACGNSEQWQWALHLLHQSHKQKVEAGAKPACWLVSTWKVCKTHWKRRLDWTFLVPFFHAGCEWADPLSNHRFTLLSFALQQFPSELAWNCWKLFMLNDACGTAVLSGTWSLQSLVAQWVSTIKVYKSYTIPLQTRWHDLTWFVYWENRLQIFRSMPSRTLLLFLLVKMVVIGFKLWHFCRNSVCSQSKAEWYTTQLPAHVRRHDNHKSWSAPKVPFYFVVFKFSSLRSEIIL